MGYGVGALQTSTLIVVQPCLQVLLYIRERSSRKIRLLLLCRPGSCTTRRGSCKNAVCGRSRKKSYIYETMSHGQTAHALIVTRDMDCARCLNVENCRLLFAFNFSSIQLKIRADEDCYLAESAVPRFEVLNSVLYLYLCLKAQWRAKTSGLGLF